MELPKHVQVREYVRALVQGAEPGTPAPSERELVGQFGVARMTVRQALDALVSEGLLERVPGRGTFVARPHEAVDVEGPELTGFSEEMLRRGMRPSSHTLRLRTEVAGPGVARALALDEGESVVHWRRLRHADDVPMCVEDAYLPASLVPGFVEDSLPESLYAELHRRALMPTWGEDSVDAGTCLPDEAELLDVEPGTPVLRVARRALAGRLAVVVSRTTYRADRFTLRMQLRRGDGPAVAGER